MWKEPEQREVISAWGGGRGWARLHGGRGLEGSVEFAEDSGAERGVFGALRGPSMVPGMTGVEQVLGQGTGQTAGPWRLWSGARSLT